MKELLLENMCGLKRLAVLEDGRLMELLEERPGEGKLAGSIFLGRVENVLPGMNAAFVDIGLEHNAFLSADDMKSRLDGDPEAERSFRRRSIRELVHPGQEILVQVTKEPGGTKGCRITTGLTFPGRMSVLLCGMDAVSISRRITDPGERERLRGIGRGLIADTGCGIILRTAAGGRSREELAADFARARAQWEEVRVKASHAIAPRLICSDEDLVLCAARDLLDETVDRVLVEDGEMLREMQRLSGIMSPELTDRIRSGGETASVFDAARVDVQFDRAMQHRIWLKSGGFLVMDETEALTVIDVNTGKFVGKQSMEETFYRLNCEAAEEIARLLRLRDVGGIVVIDFIDMALQESREKLLGYMEELLAKDRNHTGIAGFTALGLLELTRKKIRRPAAKRLWHACPACKGAGSVPSHDTLAWRAVRRAMVMRREGHHEPLCLTASRPVADRIRAIGLPEGVQLVCSGSISDGEWTVGPAGI